MTNTYNGQVHKSHKKKRGTIKTDTILAIYALLQELNTCLLLKHSIER